MARKSQGSHEKIGVDQYKQGFLSDLSCFSIDLSTPSQQLEPVNPMAGSTCELDGRFLCLRAFRGNTWVNHGCFLMF